MPVWTTCAIDRIGLIDEDLPGGYGEDYEWALRATRLGPAVCVPQPLVRIHWHEQSFFGNLTAHLGQGTEISGGLRHISYNSENGLIINGVRPMTGEHTAWIEEYRRQFGDAVVEPAIVSHSSISGSLTSSS